MPESVGLCADLYAEVRDLRLAMQKIVDKVKERESEIRNYIINELPKSQNTGAAGKRYRAQIVTKEVPTLKDWNAFTKFVCMPMRGHGNVVVAEQIVAIVALVSRKRGSAP